MELMLGISHLAATLSNITESTIENIEKWHKSLKKQYSVLYLDRTYLKLCQDDLTNELVYIVIRVNEGCYRGILG